MTIDNIETEQNTVFIPKVFPPKFEMVFYTGSGHLPADNIPDDDTDNSKQFHVLITGQNICCKIYVCPFWRCLKLAQTF